MDRFGFAAGVMLGVLMRAVKGYTIVTKFLSVLLMLLSSAALAQPLGGGCSSNCTITGLTINGLLTQTLNHTMPLSGGDFLNQTTINVTQNGASTALNVPYELFVNYNGTGSIIGAGHLVSGGIVTTYNLSGAAGIGLAKDWELIANVTGTIQTLEVEGPELQINSGGTVQGGAFYYPSMFVATGGTLSGFSHFLCGTNTGGGTLSSINCVNNNDPTQSIRSSGPFRNDNGQLGAFDTIQCNSSNIYYGNRPAVDFTNYTASGTVALYSYPVTVTTNKHYYGVFRDRCGVGYTYNNAYLRVDGGVAGGQCYMQVFGYSAGQPSGAPILGTQVTWTATASGQQTATITGGWAPGASPAIWYTDFYCNGAVTVRMYPEILTDLNGVTPTVTSLPQAYVSSTNYSGFVTNPGVTSAGTGAGAGPSQPYIGMN